MTADDRGFPAVLARMWHGRQSLLPPGGYGGGCGGPSSVAGRMVTWLTPGASTAGVARWLEQAWPLSAPGPGSRGDIMRLSERHPAGRRGLAAGRPRRARRAAVRRLSCRMAAGSVMAALVVGLTAVPVLAFTWSVHPGGSFSGTAVPGSTVITDTVTGTSVTCKSKITGTLNSGTALAGHHIGTITAAAFTGCTSAVLGATTVTAAGLPWYLNAVSYASPITSGRVTGIHLNLVAGTCSATVTGTIKFRYSNADSALKFIAASASLAFSGVTTGCGTHLASGDPATYVATYHPITPSQTITSP